MLSCMNDGAHDNQHIYISFYENMFDEVISTHKAGRQLLLNELD